MYITCTNISIISGISADEISLYLGYTLALERKILNAKIVRQFEEIKGLQDRTLSDPRFNLVP